MPISRPGTSIPEGQVVSWVRHSCAVEVISHIHIIIFYHRILSTIYYHYPSQSITDHTISPDSMILHVCRYDLSVSFRLDRSHEHLRFGTTTTNDYLCDSLGENEACCLC